ncbi:hypothetical protein HWD35_21005 [Tsukamurella tyrosinosolvens]|nr:hypothetical protein [Tsukamurella tyrosinosolvens]MCA4997206.1 hypothetical protein [Tsukamurella tyrosinosolvens]MEC4615778.1 hypothetical protein [Tsukamurella tyrosinosolvens]
MSPPAWIALVTGIAVLIQTGMKVREHLIDYPIRKRKEDEEEDEGE